MLMSSREWLFSVIAMAIQADIEGILGLYHILLMTLLALEQIDHVSFAKGL